MSDYDQLPYLSLPIAFTQPSHLAALAALHGSAPCPDPERAHVLELGCASGGNLLPLAARWPEARFLGVDLSARQVADGNRRIRYFHLENATLKKADLADLSLSARSFDYVICHGVFSWVPPTVQGAILRLIGHCLGDSGVAAISYNVLPGWHLRNPVKDILRFYARTDGTIQERVAHARAALAALGTYTGPGAYGALLRTEARQLAKIPSSYILGEFLAEHRSTAPRTAALGATNTNCTSTTPTTAPRAMVPPTCTTSPAPSTTTAGARPWPGATSSIPRRPIPAPLGPTEWVAWSMWQATGVSSRARCGRTTTGSSSPLRMSTKACS